MKYNDLLKDPRWQKKRLEIMQRDNFTCQYCGSTTNTLNVHHVYYEKGLKPWEYSLNALITLCEECHKNQHKPRYISSKPVIYKKLLQDNRLSANDKIVLSYIITFRMTRDSQVLNYRKAANKLGVSLATIYTCIKHLKNLSIISNDLKVHDATIPKGGYFEIRTDLLEEINGKLLVFYSWLCDKAKDGTLEIKRETMAKCFGEPQDVGKRNIHNMMQRLYELGYIRRETISTGEYGKIQLLK